MNPTVIGMLVFVCTFGGALAGMKLSTVLPEHHRSDPSKDTISIGIALIATMSALILGLVTASAKSSFDAVNLAVRDTAVNILTLDRTLARYGSEAAPLRADLKLAVASRIEATWPKGEASRIEFNPWDAASKIAQLVSQIGGLVPKTDQQRAGCSCVPSISRRVPDEGPVSGLGQPRRIGSDSVSRCAHLLAHDHVYELRAIRATKTRQCCRSCSSAHCQSWPQFSWF